ncbi:MAG: 30S ribosomal protein S20 [Bacteroidetes bacterium 4572_112]|nr:MAG: 30S ribosomal protein S20 [Bacteroidetes bacterium 4572_112]
MANHKSAIKRIKTSEKKRLHNRYYARSMRSAIRNFAKRGIIHKKKAANLKSKLTKQIAVL